MCVHMCTLRRIDRLVIGYNHLFDMVKFVMKFVKTTLVLLNLSVLVTNLLSNLLQREREREKKKDSGEREERGEKRLGQGRERERGEKRLEGGGEGERKVKRDERERERVMDERDE